jgi:hypothetical protein
MIEDDSAEIFGQNFDIYKYDELQFLNVRKDWQEYEVMLFGSKWFDYRFMHPVRATYLYAYEFERAYRSSFRSTIDHRAADHIRVFKKSDLFECDKTVISGIWRGRQHADALCMPYNLYVTLALEALLRHWNRNHLPRPTQIYSAEVCAAVSSEWKRRQEVQVFYSTHHAYRAQNYIGSRDQNDHHEWLLHLASKRQNPVHLLINFLKEDLLPERKIEARFGREIRALTLQSV